jgi:hypothetical protein
MVASNRLDETNQTPAMQIELRLPGPWGSSGELATALEKSDVGYGFDQGWLVRESDGWRCAVGGSPHDDEIAKIFSYDGRLSRAEVKAVADHRSKVHLVGPGGSVKAARGMVDAATALVKLGAHGVMVDNSTATHSPTDWMALANDTQTGGMYWIFTALSGGPDEVWSSGQHCLGLRDAEMPSPPDEQFAYLLVHNFLGYVYASGRTVHDGDVVDGPGRTIYRATQHPCTRLPPDTAFFNPYGIWRLERVEEGQSWPKESYHAIK